MNNSSCHSIPFCKIYLRTINFCNSTVIGMLLLFQCSPGKSILCEQKFLLIHSILKTFPINYQLLQLHSSHSFSFPVVHLASARYSSWSAIYLMRIVVCLWIMMEFIFFVLWSTVLQDTISCSLSRDVLFSIIFAASMFSLSIEILSSRIFGVFFSVSITSCNCFYMILNVPLF